MPSSPKQEAALRKRQQIAKANRTMFIWVAGASAIIGLAAVLVVTFAQRLYFNEKVLAEKNTTVSTLKHNNDIVGPLKDNIRVLNTNETLNDLRVPADNDAVQVVFDALPATANSAALGTTLQSSKLLGQSGIKIESLSVTPVSGVEDAATSDGLAADIGTENSISFEFSVSASKSDIGKLKDVMKSLERSIRALNVTQMTVETQGDRVVMNVAGLGYYEPAKAVELTDKEVK